MPFAPDCPPWPALEPDCAPGDPWDWPPAAVLPPGLPDWPGICAPGIPDDDDAPLASELLDVPVEDDVCGADPGVADGMPALGVLPEPLEDEEDEEEEEEEDEDGEPDEEEEPPADGIPPDELLEEEEVAQPVTASRVPAAASTATRRSCADTCAVGDRVTRFIAAPSGSARLRICCTRIHPGHVPGRVSFESGLPKLNGT